MVGVERIGGGVMAGLKGVAHVAYIRFAGVCKDFSEPQDFAEIVESVESAPVVDDKSGRLL